MKYKLFISDFDGTLGKSAGNSIEPETVDAIKKFTDKGGIFAVCTGRMFTSIQPICLKCGLSGLIASYQGAMINDIETGKSILDGGIDAVNASKIAKELIDDGVSTVADIGDVMYCEEFSRYTEFHKPFSKIEVVNDLPKFIIETGKFVHKIVAVGEPDTINRLTKKYSEIYKGQFLFNNGADFLIEVINPKFSKGNSVRFLANYYGVPLDQVIAVGDSTNDIELLSGEWRGVAVGDARDELKAVADEITVQFKEQPVKVLLEKYCL